MKLEKLAGATSEIWQVFVQDSSSTTGAGLTGLTNASSGLTAYYHRDTDTTATAISLVSMTVGTFTSSGFKEIDATNMPGWYQFCPPNAAIASGAKSCGFHLKGATNMAPLPIEVQLVAYNPDAANVAQTGDSYARLGAPAGASVSADIATANGLPTATIADSVPADGSRPSPNQALYAIYSFLFERAVSGTTLTVKKVDGATSLMTFTLNDASTPTSITRAS
jgi:hypothetical protein